MQIRSTIGGTLIRILVAPGQTIATGHELALIESMKMEIPLIAESAGVVKEIFFSPGEFVQEDDVVMVLGA
ncbi:MAG: acetyl-CoA carboxylase biotin carboxyl carrier protein subunit [Sterolibacterium sp.]|jgi:acetyl-CoA carboxylase biotin carboxyl carrier protein